MNRRKILVVDDDEVVAQSLSIKLRNGGYDVLVATDGSAAISKVRTEKPDLILLDLSFPPDVGSGLFDGFSIMSWLKRLEEAAKIPIIVITGGEAREVEAKAKASGATAFFHKPIDHKDLLAVIAKTLGENSAPPS